MIGGSAAPARAAAHDPGPPPARARGSAIGRYLVLGAAGEGGMGTVVVAYDPELDRRVALKLLRADAHELDGDLRLVREARALAKLSHPNVVPVYDVGEHEGSVYMAMELVEGQTLRGWLAEPRSWREIVQVLEAAGQGLLAAHEAGVVHRDFKPSNVMIGRDARVRVVDFGLARPASVDAGQGTSSGLAALSADVSHGSILGTPSYMAPEQHEGGPIDGRADQFAFSVTLHEALFGARPFQSTTREAIADRRPVRPDGVRLPGRLRRILERGLAPDPRARFGSMADLLAELRHIRRRRGRVVRLASLALALCAGAGATWWLRPQPDPAAEDAMTSLSAQARDAAAEILFVYPPPDDPQRPTAYARVLELEALDLPAAQEQAQTLRSEFAATLNRVGDEYWDREGGRAFALDYYAQALVFDPDDAHALERASFLPGELAALRDKAATSRFSAAELDAGALLAALAVPDPDARAKAVADTRARRRGPRAVSTDVNLEALVGATASEAVAAPSEPDVASAKAATAAPDPAPAEVVAAPDPVPGHKPAHAGSITPGPETANTEPLRDRDAARALVTQAKAALGRRDHGEAERLLHRAVEADPKSDAAVGLLSDVCFDRGRYDEAVRWARKAVRLAPKTAAHRMRLGDALFKVLRYADARAAYVEAQTLGASSAGARIVQIDEKLGRGPRRP